MILEWIRKNPQLALILTELVNVMLHGVGTAAAVMFTFGGTIINVLMIFGVAPVQGYVAKTLRQLKDLRNKEVA
jgi:hypothetical protein